MFEQRFTYYFDKYGLAFDGRAMQAFRLFAERLLRENEKYNLTAIRDLDGVISRHFADSAILLKHVCVPENSRVLDIGAGAGFPSVPLAILRPDLHVTCLDSSAKKISFIKGTAELLGLRNLDYICGRAEDLKTRGIYDFAVSRAVARLNVLCELAAPALRIGGVFCAYKAKSADGELRGCERAMSELGLELEGVSRFELEGEQRVITAMRKSRATPAKYPRAFSQISKKPL